ncbi:acetaldehyde dehydrogenase (acetylating) [Trinickia symbiotica]|uniref:Acetaldehyde dehydrogenase n=1 Tax=Trinickia symbiotica TaxID=863227 RepID=A0A2T3XJV9_9BURK|nr:acetaldehyde dehydrogenase (acetylating) [Trinickia symbiotica]PTB16824.1 acetaldehyde dehydrogenase (acetylating) [Trinickia symbiotica]
MNDPRTTVAIIGPGNIGTDLMCKVLESEDLSLAFVVGRNPKSRGLAIAKERGVETSADGIDFLQAHSDAYDIVFDATDAYAHVEHNAFFSASGKFAVDLTPACIGMACVPSVNLVDVAGQQNVSLITCGGQASVPLVHALRQVTQQIDYLEVVSTIAAASAGVATRENINNYLTTTERALSQFSGANAVKAILNINPAEPGVSMQTTIYANAKFGEFSEIEDAIGKAVASVQEYVPGFQIVLAPVLDAGRITVSVKVHGSGHHLPSYAGNLDIINCAAVAVAAYKGSLTRSVQS